MENQNNPEENQLQIELTPEVAQGTYTNLAILSHSHAEFIADFVRIVPGMNKAPVVSRLIIAPEHAKRLLFALQDNIAKYEKQFGAILKSFSVNDDTLYITRTATSYMKSPSLLYIMYAG